MTSISMGSRQRGHAIRLPTVRERGGRTIGVLAHLHGPSWERRCRLRDDPSTVRGDVRNLRGQGRVLADGFRTRAPRSRGRRAAPGPRRRKELAAASAQTEFVQGVYAADLVTRAGAISRVSAANRKHHNPTAADKTTKPVSTPVTVASTLSMVNSSRSGRFGLSGRRRAHRAELLLSDAVIYAESQLWGSATRPTVSGARCRRARATKCFRSAWAIWPGR